MSDSDDWGKAYAQVRADVKTRWDVTDIRGFAPMMKLKPIRRTAFKKGPAKGLTKLAVAEKVEKYPNFTAQVGDVLVRFNTVFHYLVSADGTTFRGTIETRHLSEDMLAHPGFAW